MFNGYSYPAWTAIFLNPNTTITQAVIDPSFKDFRPTTTSKWFSFLTALTQITGMENLNTSEVTDMSRMFDGCSALTKINVTKFDTKNVTDMSGMFSGCTALTQLNITKFDTKNVTNMNRMFEVCSALTKLDVSKFDTKNVTDMSEMFYGCTALTQLDVTKFNTKNVTDMSSMFHYCSKLTTIYCNDTWTCNKSNKMFAACPKLKGAVSYDESKTNVAMANPNTGYFTKKTNDNREAYVVKTNNGKTLTFYYDTQKATRPGTKWGIKEKHEGTSIPAWAGIYKSPNTTTTQAVIDPSFKDFRPKTTACWFNRLQALTQITGIEHLNTSEVTDMYAMFYECKALTQLNVTKFDTKKVTDMGRMFFNCSTLTQLDVTKFDTKNVTDMSAMFYNCSALTQLDVTKFDTKKVTDMSYMFFNCPALTQLDVTKFDTKNVTNMRNMFYSCSGLTQLDVTKFDTKNVTDMSAMFADCKALTQLDVTKFDTKNVTKMSYMFFGCSGLTQLDVTKFDTKNVTDMSSMFNSCSLLTQLDVTKFDTKKVTDMQLMFHGCFALTTIYCNDTWTCGNSKDMFVACPKLKGAASYDESKTDVAMANPNTGYFTKKGSAGIAQTSHAATIKAIYSIDGRRLKEIQPGVNIVKMSDGTTRKIIKK